MLLSSAAALVSYSVRLVSYSLYLWSTLHHALNGELRVLSQFGGLKIHVPYLTILAVILGFVLLYRDQYKTEYEAKLREEMELIRTRTNSEIDRLKSSTKEMYERENRSLREARDMSMSERDRALASEKEAISKYENLMQE